MNEQVDWQAVVRAALAARYPRLPDPLPPVVESLVPVWAERAQSMPVGVRTQQIGGYMVTYEAGDVEAWTTDVERAILVPYRRIGAGSTRVS